MIERLRASTKTMLRTTLGERRGSGAIAGVGDAISRASYALSADGRRSRRQLAALQNLHNGQRCFVIGNGPSLRLMDLSPLKDEITFGLNRAYLMFETLGFATSYLVSVNRLVIEQCAGDFRELPIPRFFAWHSREHMRGDAESIFVRTTATPGFSQDPCEGMWEGGTVTYVALQLAYYMGFREVILIGVDHSFTTTGPAHLEVTSAGEDPNHFDPRYFGKGFRWNLPDLEMSEIAYGLAQDAFKADGRSIIDATTGGKLQIFPKVDFTRLFDSASLVMDR